MSVKQRLRDSGLFGKERPPQTNGTVSFELQPKTSLYVLGNDDEFDILVGSLRNNRFPNNAQLFDFVKRRGRLVRNSESFRLCGDDVDEVIRIMKEGFVNAEPWPTPLKALNTILYGPPGTGKTYQTARHCVETCDGTTGLPDDDIRDRYQELVNCERIEFITFHQSYGYEEFVEGLRPSPSEDGQGGLRLEATPGVLKRIADRARKHQESRYVLVIDEINRANVSKVMGELITLLEEDKREGAEHEVAVTLPHSGERFTLPQNLYILGTMNTADRSIALIDTALRRRFEFDEIAPKPELLKVVERINLPDVLEAINERLEYLIDRDHLIGHAWLMNAGTKAEVDRIMRRKIIPLIAEYFYDDWRKVRAVLGNTDHFVRSKRLARPPGLDEVDMDERYRWTVREKFAGDAYHSLVSGQSSALAAPADDADG